MKIIGIHDGHNAAASLVENGRVLYASQEERFTGEKNFYGFPSLSIQHLLDTCDLTPESVDAVTFGSHYLPTPRPARQVKDDLEQGNRRDLATLLKARIAETKYWQGKRARERMAERSDIVTGMGFRKDRVHFYDHHLCHAATAYYGLASSPEERHLILTLDGEGDGLAATVSIGHGGKLERLATTSSGDSLGMIYALVTHIMGFMPLEHEYKLMGMAPYASEKGSRKVAKILEGYLGLDPGNPLRFKRRVPEPTRRVGHRLERDLRGHRFDAVCGGLQLFTEELMAAWVRECVKRTGVQTVLAAGGVFMNVKANKRLLELDEVDYFEAFPSCGDETLSIGAPYVLGGDQGTGPVRLDSYYLGGDLDDPEIESELASRPNYRVERPADMAERVAGLLAEGQIVARCAGRMEFGARALGNRSILADPINLGTVRTINKMIKNRDFWMPFAPVVRREDAAEVLVNPKAAPSPYMMMGFDTKGQREDFIAAIQSEDLTARPQILEPGQNPGYEAILAAFKRITGRSVLLNTSLNLHGFPIVRGPVEAMDLFDRSGLEHMVLGDSLVSKQ